MAPSGVERRGGGPSLRFTQDRRLERSDRGRGRAIRCPQGMGGLRLRPFTPFRPALSVAEVAGSGGFDAEFSQNAQDEGRSRSPSPPGRCPEASWYSSVPGSVERRGVVPAASGDRRERAGVGGARVWSGRAVASACREWRPCAKRSLAWRQVSSCRKWKPCARLRLAQVFQPLT